MKYKTLKGFKKKLRELIRDPDIKKFKKFIRHCPFYSSCKYSENGPRRYCPECPLSDKNGPIELMGVADECLMGSMMDIYWDYSVYESIVNDEEIVAELVLRSIKLLAYLESKEE